MKPRQGSANFKILNLSGNVSTVMTNNTSPNTNFLYMKIPMYQKTRSSKKKNPQPPGKKKYKMELTQFLQAINPKGKLLPPT